MQENTNLLPCPFCGNTEIKTDSLLSQKVSQVFCNDCGLMVQQRVDEETLIKFWNTRPVEDALRKRVKRLEKAIKKVLPNMLRNTEMMGKADYWTLKEALEEKP